MKNKLEIWLSALKIGLVTEAQVLEEIVQFVYDRYKENTLTLFLQIQELDKKSKDKEYLFLYQGLQDAVHGMSGLARDIIENKTKMQVNERVKFYFKEDNIAMLIQICKAYFPSGNCNGASTSGKWFFEKFKEILIRHKSKYIKGGDSYQWTINMGHNDYIDLVLNNKDKYL